MASGLAQPDGFGRMPWPQKSKRRKRRRGRLRWKLLAGLAILAVLVYFAPAMVAATGLWRTLVARASPPLAGKIDAASVRLGWFSSVELQGLKLHDPAGQVLAEAKTIRSQKVLLDLLLTYPNVGFLVVEEPRAYVALREGGSNVEDLLALFPSSDEPSGKVSFGLRLTDGIVELDDQIAGRKWRLDRLAAEVAWPAASDQSRKGQVSCAIAPLAAVGGQAEAAAIAGGQLSASFSWQPSDDGTQDGSGEAQLVVQQANIEALEGALRRFVGDIRPRGALSLDAVLAWDSGENLRQLKINQLATPGVTVAAPALLGSDQPTLVVSACQGEVHLAGDAISLRGLALDSNVLQLRGEGAAHAAALSPAALRAPAADADLDVRGRIDLAELTRQLPATLRLRPGTQVRSGLLDVALVSLNQPDGRHWQGTLRTENIQATAGNVAIQFQEPLTIDVALRQTKTGLAIERLEGRASFLNLEGQGTLDGGTISAHTDLSRLVTEIGRLVDLGDVQLAGTLEAALRWNRDANNTWSAVTEGIVQNFALSAPGMLAWKEPHLQLRGDMAGAMQDGQLAQVRSGKLTIEAGADRLGVELTDAVPTPSLDAVWPVKFVLRGDLATWAPRFQTVVSLGGLNVAGAVEASGAARLSARASEADATQIQIENLALDGFGLSIREPIVKIETAGAWDQPQSTLTLGSTTLASSSLAFRADGIRIVASSEPSVVGLIDFRGDLGQLSKWLSSPHAAPGWQLAGALTGRIEIGYRGQTLAGTWQADVENFQYLTASQTGATPPQLGLVWEEPRIHLAGRGTYDPKQAALVIEQTNLVGSSASFGITGSIDRLTSDAVVKLSGEVAYDLARVAEQLKTYARRSTPRGEPLPYGLETLALEGKERRKITLQGPLSAPSSNLAPAGSFRTASTRAAGAASFPEGLSGETSLAWQRLQYVGLVAGPSELPARLASGIVLFGPLDMPISEGRLTTAPRLHLNEPSPLLVIDRGPLLANVRISPEMCRLWLKFVAPLVAEATRAEGTFSVGLEGALIPPASPSESEIVGTLQIHAAQVGPGPLAQQYIAMARSVRTLFDSSAGAAVAVDPERGWLQLPEQNVPFEVRRGVVEHRGLMMTVRDVTITTSGSVNVQTQELNLLASVPLAESWFKRQDGIFASLKGQTIVVPIRGTLTRPQLDGKVIENLAKQLAGAAVQGVIDRQLQRGLDRLFGPAQPRTTTPPVAPESPATTPPGTAPMVPIP